MSVQAIAEHAYLEVAEDYRVEDDKLMALLAKKISILNQIEHGLEAELKAPPEAVRGQIGELLAIEHVVVVDQVVHVAHA